MSDGGSDGGSQRFLGGSRRFPPVPGWEQRRGPRGGRDRKVSPRGLRVVPGSRAYKGTTPGNHLGNHLAGQQRSGDSYPVEDASPATVDDRATPAGTGHLHPALVSRQEARPACGHVGASVVLTVKGRGQICGDCWCRWVCGDLDWPVGEQGPS